MRGDIGDASVRGKFFLALLGCSERLNAEATRGRRLQNPSLVAFPVKPLNRVTTEKEPEIQIGNPTDVKHVAHIGWDGPSQNPPTWMNDFKGGGQETGDLLDGEGSARDLPKSSSRSTGMESGSKSERGKSRKSSRKVHRDSDSSKAIQISDEQSLRHKSSKEGSRKTRKKKSKDASSITDGSGKSRSSRSAATEGSSRGSTSFPDVASESESESKFSNHKYAKGNSDATDGVIL